MIPFSNAWTVVGRVNPGLGYWWTNSCGEWFLVPDRRLDTVEVNLFWPIFFMTLALFAIWHTRHRWTPSR